MSGGRGWPDWKKEAEGNAVGGVQEKAERDRVHEGDVEEVEFLAHGRAVVVVPPEGDAGARRRKFTDKGRGPANQPEPPGSRPADQMIAANKKAARKAKT